MLHQVKELPNDSGSPLSYNNFTDKKQNGFFFVVVAFLRCFTYRHSKSGFINDHTFCISIL